MARGRGRRARTWGLGPWIVAAACSGSGERPAEERGAPAASARDASAEPGLALELDPASLPGSILFVSERDGDLEVYRWRASSALERLTRDPASDFVAEVDPQGRGWTHVITHDGESPEEHRERLWWMPAQGEPVAIGPEGRRARGPSWAPDRSFVVFESDAEGAFSDLWRWDREGGGLTRLTRTEHGAFEPAVSPDGRSIAFVSTQDGNPEIYLMDADGSAPRRLTSWRRDDMAPRWSPDGTMLAFLRREQGGERLFVLELRPDGSTAERRLVPTAEGEEVAHADHGWSPDGTRLAFTEHRPRQPPRVEVAPVAPGGSPRVVSPSSLGATMPSWSPDGRFIVLAGTLDGPEALDLYVVALESGAVARLTDAAASDWLPRWSG